MPVVVGVEGDSVEIGISVSSYVYLSVLYGLGRRR